jgi:hypothetical protein
LGNCKKSNLIMISCNIYVDNQEIINYPIYEIIQKLDFIDYIFIYCGDQISHDIIQQLVKDPRITIEIINFKIRQPDDIAIAQNMCIELTKKKVNTGYILILQADTQITPAGKQYILEWIANPTGPAISFITQHVKLYIETYTTNWGADLIEINAINRYIGDGAYLSPNPDTYGESAGFIDIGYMSSDIWYKKIKQHRLTWNSEAGLAQQTLYETDKDRFILEMGKYLTESHNDVRTFIDINNPVWLDALTSMNLLDDYLYTKKLLEL